MTLLTLVKIWEDIVACACEKDRGKGNKCAWCKEAIVNGIPPAQHKCSSFGKCSR